MRDLTLALVGAAVLLLVVWANTGPVRAAVPGATDTPAVEAPAVCDTPKDVAIAVMQDLEAKRLAGTIVPLYLSDGRLILQVMLAGVPFGMQFIFVDGCLVGSTVAPV